MLSDISVIIASYNFIIKEYEAMNDPNNNDLKNNAKKELQKGKASSCFGVFILLTTITLIIILIFVGFLLANFINTP